LSGLVVIAAAALLAPPLVLGARRLWGPGLRWRSWPGWRRLTACAAMERHADVDRAGRLLVYEATPEHRAEVRLKDLRTGRERVLSTPEADALAPRVSGDGRVAAWERVVARAPSRRSELVLADLETGRLRVEPTGFDHVAGVALGGAGTRILVAGAVGGRRRLRWCDGSGREGPWLVPGGGEQIAPCLSDDGTHAAFLAGHEGRFAPCLVTLPDGTPWRVGGERDARALEASADGRWLAWEARDGGPATVRLLDVLGRRAATVAPGFAPRLSADGRWLAFDRVDDAYDLWVVDLGRGRTARVSRGNPYPHEPRFAGSPDALVLCAGHLNPLARTGDCDLFQVRLDRLPASAWTPLPLAWQPVGAEPLPPEPDGPAPTPPPPPPSSLWVASWYRLADGSLAPLEQQDRDGIEVYSERLAALIDQVRAATGAPRVNLVCHCMGGLVARGAVQYARDGGFGFPGQDGSPGYAKVRRLVTVASPLGGNSFLGLLRVARRLRLPLYRRGFSRQGNDMVRGSAFLERTTAACLKPLWRDAPPFHHVLTGDGWGPFDGAVTLAAARPRAQRDDARLQGADEWAVLRETAHGAWTTGPGRRLVHVPEDIVGDRVTEDKSRALCAWLLERLEPDLPVVFVHGSYLYRGAADLSWRVVMHRLTGEVPGWPARYVRPEVRPDGSGPAWLLETGGG
jgi:hypothetical protein